MAKVLERRVDGPAEVAYLEHIEGVEYVLRFDVAMDDVVTVQVADAADHLSEVKRSKVLLEIVLLADLLEETAVSGELQ